MTSPSKFGAAFLTVFGLPFLGMGLLFAVKSLQTPGQPAASRIGGALFGSVFAIIGGGLIFGALKGYSQLKEQAQTASANPGSPWLWRKDWASRRIESHNKSQAIGWWVVAVLVNMISLPMTAAAYPQFSRAPNPSYIVLAIFDLAGLVLVFAAIRATIRFDRFGKTYFEMSTLPYSPGGHVTGAVHAQIPGDVPHGIDLTLSCLRRISTGGGDNRSTQEVPLWEDSKNIPSASLARGPLDTVISVDFAIPPDAYQTDRSNINDQVYWTLKVKADVPGVDYSDQFELPVFRTSRSQVPAASSSSEDCDVNLGYPRSSGRFASATAASTSGSAFASREAAQDVAEPAQHRVIVQDSPDGLEFYFRAGRNLGRTLLILVLTAAVTAFFVSMLRNDRRAPVFAFVAVGLLDFFLVLASIHTALSSTRIVAGNGTISWKRSILGIGFSRQVQVSEVDSIVPATSIQQAGSSGSTLYSLRLRTKNGNTQTLVDDIQNRQEARWIAFQLEKRAGLALNTQVEVSNSIYGLPPQPAATGTPDFASYQDRGRMTLGATGSLSRVIGAIFFAVWLGFFGLMIFRMTGIRKAQTRAASSAARAGSMRAEAMKRGTLEDVAAFPAQQQAEELLARSVAHDAAALQLLARSSAGWAGLIQRTDHLDQLENQARYSSDLRVRRAEADLELAADGCRKDSSCVDVLMDHARTNPSDRALDLYELGILAGDGVESARVHPFVLDYARKDSDPAVRQWATEGLRFLGTDQALDELFDIFTHDTSSAVRDRAGCNISDCGIFQRKQRLRMVPRLIDLVADPQLNPQMKGWCFMALREITGENLPADASAWRGWYGANGAAKRTQFEALNWWEVSGDN